MCVGDDECAMRGVEQCVELWCGSKADRDIADCTEVVEGNVRGDAAVACVRQEVMRAV